MRIAVSGTHCTGKSTLIEDFLARHGDYIHEPEPYEWLAGEAFSAEPDAAAFHRQLEVSVERLTAHPRGTRVIAERSPLDFVAYLLALEDLGRGASGLVDSAVELAAEGMQHVDLLVVLPLNAQDGIAAPEDEDLELREAMNDRLLDLVTTEVPGGTRVVELQGSREDRLAALEGVVMR